MSTGVVLPAAVAAFGDLESTPERAATFAVNLRAVAVGVKDVQGWAATHAAPGWAGEASRSHDHTLTRFASRLDGSEAALERAVTAADRFEDRLLRLRTERTSLETERVALNEDVAALRAEVEAAADESRMAEFRRRAGRLIARADELVAGIGGWLRRRDDAESDFIAALARVDTLQEGAAAATDPGRPDVDGLAQTFERLRDDPEALALWWARLDRAQRQALATEHPRRVGNAGGIPARDRDEANRAAVYHDVDYLGQREDDGQLGDGERAMLDNARHVRDVIDDNRAFVDPATGEEMVRVLVYLPGEHGRDGGVAIALGDPDTADHVSVNVPGFSTETSSLADNVDRMHDLHDAARDAGRGTVATVYWADYDAPSGDLLDPRDLADLGGVAFADKAADGGERLADFLDGLGASDSGTEAHTTAIGHSYGSTTLGHALGEGADVDDAVVIGSPGQPADTARDLTDADLWVGSMDNDPVTLLGDGDRGGVGALGQDPAEDDFGGTRFDAGDGSPHIEDLLDNHTSYYAGESLDNLARIVTEDDAAVTTDPHRGDPGGEYLTLDELLVATGGNSANEWLQDRGEDLSDLLDGVWDRSPVGTLIR